MRNDGICKLDLYVRYIDTRKQTTRPHVEQDNSLIFTPPSLGSPRSFFAGLSVIQFGTSPVSARGNEQPSLFICPLQIQRHRE